MMGLLAAREIGKGMMNLVDAERSAALYADIEDAREISGGSAANTAVGIVALAAPPDLPAGFMMMVWVTPSSGISARPG